MAACVLGAWWLLPGSSVWVPEAGFIPVVQAPCPRRSEVAKGDAAASFGLLAAWPPVSNGLFREEAWSQRGPEASWAHLRSGPLWPNAQGGAELTHLKPDPTSASSHLRKGISDWDVFTFQVLLVPKARWSRWHLITHFLVASLLAQLSRVNQKSSSRTQKWMFVDWMLVSLPSERRRLKSVRGS